MLSNDKISTGLSDRVYSWYKIVSRNPRSFLIVSSNTKLIIGPCGEISIIDPNVIKFDLILKW